VFLPSALGEFYLGTLLCVNGVTYLAKICVRWEGLNSKNNLYWRGG
jgi:hypothetical protein